MFEKGRRVRAAWSFEVLGALAFCGPGLFNALNGLGNAPGSRSLIRLTARRGRPTAGWRPPPMDAFIAAWAAFDHVPTREIGLFGLFTEEEACEMAGTQALSRSSATWEVLPLTSLVPKCGSMQVVPPDELLGSRFPSGLLREHVFDGLLGWP